MSALNELGLGSGATPLHVAAEVGNTETAQALIFAAGAVVDVPDNEGRTPLHSAARSGYGETLEMLISAGADGNTPDRKWSYAPAPSR